MTVVERLYLHVIAHRQQHGCNPPVLLIPQSDRDAPEFARTPLLQRDTAEQRWLFMGVPLETVGIASTSGYLRTL